MKPDEEEDVSWVRLWGNEYRRCFKSRAFSKREPKPDVIANMATALHTTSDYLLGIKNDDLEYHQVRRMIARNASSMTKEEKMALISVLFGEE